MKYLKSEHLKFRRTFFNKLLIIAPLITAVFAWLMAGFTGFQYMSLYWWYSFLLPGTITVLCYLSNQKEIRADKYYSVYSMSINLKKFWISKNLILIEKMIFAAFILALLVCVSNIISPSTVIFTPGQSFIGSVAIMIASIWQIPLCLFLIFKIGLFMPLVVNTAFGIFLPGFFGTTSLWWLCPYCWAPKLSESLMGIGINGTLNDTPNVSILPVAIYNLGTGMGCSVLDIVKNFEAATGVKIPYVIKPRRAGDIATCYCDASKAEKELGWKAENGIREMCEDFWRWQSNNPQGYEE